MPETTERETSTTTERTQEERRSEFGSQKLEEVLEYIEKLEEQVEQLKVAADPSLPADLETRAEYPSC